MQTLQRFTDLMHLTINLEVILIQESGFIGLLSVTFGKRWNRLCVHRACECIHVQVCEYFGVYMNAASMCINVCGVYWVQHNHVVTLYLIMVCM